jgi:hypothetical protein
MLSLELRSRTSSMPVSPNSLTMTAVPAPSGVDRNWRTRVVFPAPRNPVTTVTGIRVPRSRRSRRPNGPEVEEGNSSSMGFRSAERAATAANPESGSPCRRRGRSLDSVLAQDVPLE